MDTKGTEALTSKISELVGVLDSIYDMITRLEEIIRAFDSKMGDVEDRMGSMESKVEELSEAHGTISILVHNITKNVMDSIVCMKGMLDNQSVTIDKLKSVLDYSASKKVH